MIKPQDQPNASRSDAATVRGSPLKFFNPFERIEVSHGNLPHWEQTNATYFITWRTADSIPQDLLKQWHHDRQRWLVAHGIDPLLDDLHWQIECLPETQRREYHRLFTKQWHELLDAGHGACVLRDSALAQLVGSALLHFDGERCDVHEFIVMPNHVHVLASIDGRGKMKSLCKSWKRFSATEINRNLGKWGEFWQPESFDHIVRSQSSMDRFRTYLRENPIKAHLCTGEYLHWERPSSSVTT